MTDNDMRNWQKLFEHCEELEELLKKPDGNEDRRKQYRSAIKMYRSFFRNNAEVRALYEDFKKRREHNYERDSGISTGTGDPQSGLS